MVPRSGTRRVTLEDVARAAGVSRATVSRVVNGSPRVDLAITQNVNAAIALLNYVPNQAARTLMTQRTNTIALVASESGDRVFGDPYFSSLIRGVSQGLSGSGWQMTIVMVQNDAEAEDAARYLTGGHVDGALLISEHGGRGLAGALTAAGIPIVIGGRPMDSTVHAAYVDHDNIRGAQLAARHLLSGGRSRVGTISGPQDMSAGVDRLLGFRRGLGDAFVSGLVQHGDFTSPSGIAAMENLLAVSPDVDGVFAASDLMALGALKALHRAGRRVPEDVAVVGYDDISLAEVSIPPLTTVRQDTSEQGRRMADILLGKITEAGQRSSLSPAAVQDQSVILPVSLVVRESA